LKNINNFIGLTTQTLLKTHSIDRNHSEPQYSLWSQWPALFWPKITSRQS